MSIRTAHQTARELVAASKGILAADESPATIAKRFAHAGVQPSADSRRQWRELMLGTQGLSQFISGVILHDETIRDDTTGGISFPALLHRQGLIAGVKVDRGAGPLALHPDEQVTDGLDGLRGRLAEYRQLGARFAKWRAVFTIGENRPSSGCIQANVHALARYAALCQEAQLTAIVEPDVLIAGKHTIESCHEATMLVLTELFTALSAQRVPLAGVLLKTNMITGGEDCPHQPDAERIASHTLSCLRQTVPAQLPGIVFLSGGQDPEQATRNLRAIAAAAGDVPWQLSFSFARALQQHPLTLWRGSKQSASAAQDALLARAQANALARQAHGRLAA